MSRSTAERKGFAAQFLSGENPLYKLIFRFNKGAPGSGIISTQEIFTGAINFPEQPVEEPWMPVATPPGPDKLTPRQQLGELNTSAQMQRGKMHIQNGFSGTFDTNGGKIIAFFDSRMDVVVRSTIAQLHQIQLQRPWLSPLELVFYASLLSFGDWGQLRHSLHELPRGKEAKPFFYWGEFVRGVKFDELDCTMFAFTLQMVLQHFTVFGRHAMDKVAYQSTLPRPMETEKFQSTYLHLGYSARFGTEDTAFGPHAWVVVECENQKGEIEERIIDFALFPREIEEIYAKVRKKRFWLLWCEFQELFGNFPVLYRDSKHPTLEQHHDLVLFGEARSHMMRAQNVAHYFSDKGEYLYSCRIPTSLQGEIA